MQVIQTGPDPGRNANALPEADLDVEWAGAMAPNATLIYVYSSSSNMAVFHTIDENLAPVLSQSSGICEKSVPTALPATYQAEAKKANSMGMTWVVAAGDTGASNCDHPGPFATQGLAVSFPSDIPQVTAVGGTEFSEGTGAGDFWSPMNTATGASAQSYVPEMAWNDTMNAGYLASGGGGVSKIFPKPAWQNRPGCAE